MSSSKSHIYEGCFGIHKPTSISSAQVLRDLETHFNPSALFRPNLEAEREAVRQEKANNPRFKRKRGPNRQHRVKMGHGGTLDPLATGVLVTGVGKGTKCLNQFLACTKTYECIVLFGCATDSYDSVGKIVARAPYSHVTKETVEHALEKFKGKTMQRPPVFSALRVKGKHLYEYAREGLEIPEIKERPVEVTELELVEWIEPGSHEWRYPKEEVPQEEKAAADRLLHATLSEATKEAQKESPEATELKRKREEEDDGDELVKDDPSAKRPNTKTETEPAMSGALPADAEAQQNGESTSEQPSTSSGNLAEDPPTTTESLPDDGANAPAVRIRMTVSSGFYVRSLCHDLGAAVNSLGVMTMLERTRQGDFELGKNVLEYEDLAKGEEVWGPQVQKMLQEWMIKEGWAKAAEFEQAEEVKAGAGVESKTDQKLTTDKASEEA